jgi:hypothetical protein
MQEQASNNAISNLNARLEPLTHGVEAAPALVRLRITGKAIESAAAAVRRSAAAALQDSTKTNDARRLHAANIAIKLAKPALSEHLDGAQRARDQLGHIAVQARHHLLPRDSEEARELRQAILALPSQDRINALEAAAQNQDWDLVRAVAGAHPLLTNAIPREYVLNLTDNYLRQVVPDLVMERDRLAEAVEIADLMARELRTLVGQYDDDNARALREKVSALADEVA